MDLGVAERLICPAPHSAAPLIVRADSVDGRRLVQGLLGCPVCMQEWRVASGVLQLGAPTTLPAITPGDPHVVAALLGLAEPMLVLADGPTDELVRVLGADYAASVVALDSVGDAHAATGIDGATYINGATRVPLAPGIMRAALLLRSLRDAAFTQSVVSAVAPGGRVVAAVNTPIVSGLREIARDHQWWVAERETAPIPVTLRRSRA